MDLKQLYAEIGMHLHYIDEDLASHIHENEQFKRYCNDSYEKSLIPIFLNFMRANQIKEESNFLQDLNIAFNDWIRDNIKIQIPTKPEALKALYKLSLDVAKENNVTTNIIEEIAKKDNYTIQLPPIIEGLKLEIKVIDSKNEEDKNEKNKKDRF